MAQDDDPHAPYKVYERDELKGTYATRAEARVARKALCANGRVDGSSVAPVVTPLTGRAVARIQFEHYPRRPNIP